LIQISILYLSPPGLFVHYMERIRRGYGEVMVINDLLFEKGRLAAGGWLLASGCWLLAASI
ncbi:MAG TPA: hypothetical protein PKE52_15255, partial [Bacteroidales bacterium]|nr:hypothetical protein [Bacteroidales bacterium]